MIFVSSVLRIYCCVQETFNLLCKGPVFYVAKIEATLLPASIEDKFLRLRFNKLYFLDSNVCKASLLLHHSPRKPQLRP